MKSGSIFSNNIHSMSAHKTALLFLTDKTSPEVLDRYKSMADAVEDKMDTFFLFHSRKDNFVPRLEAPYTSYCFTYGSLLQLNYKAIHDSLVPGSNHFPVLQFFRDFPGYKYYWCVEDDVWFNGNWRYFFEAFASMEHDFISAHLRLFNQEPEWFWWEALFHNSKSIPLQERIRAFNPIYRLSAPALSYIHACLHDNWCGHHEVLIPTLLYRNNFRLLDFGGEGVFVLPDGKNRFYTSCNNDPGGNMKMGTMRFRPLWEISKCEPNMLYHPVKLYETYSE